MVESRLKLIEFIKELQKVEIESKFKQITRKTKSSVVGETISLTIPFSITGIDEVYSAVHEFLIKLDPKNNPHLHVDSNLESWHMNEIEGYFFGSFRSSPLLPTFGF